MMLFFRLVVLLNALPQRVPLARLGHAASLTQRPKTGGRSRPGQRRPQDGQHLLLGRGQDV